MSPSRFGVRNPVPANLLAIALVLGGIYAAFSMRREFFPESDPESLSVAILYPGATPSEIEESMVRKVEDAVADLEGVKQLTTSIVEGSASVLIEFDQGTDLEDALRDAEQAVESLQDLPPDAERIRVVEFEPTLPVIMLSLHGDADERQMKTALRSIADDLRSLPGMGSVLLSGIRDNEIRVEVDPATSRRYGIGLPEISDAIGRWMREVPSGSLRTSGGTINVRTLGVAEQGERIGEIVLRTDPDGASVRVSDVAEVVEGFVDVPIERRFNGDRAVSLTVFKTADEDAVKIAEMVRSYVVGRRGLPFEGSAVEHALGSHRLDAWRLGSENPEALPGGIDTHSDLARFIEGRLDLLSRNALQGAVLVFLMLFLALNLRVAFWVMVGLVTALAGTLLFMLALGVTLNLLTMFGLLITLGMLTDDAIVVSENILARHEHGESPEQAAISGAEQVGWPVLATVSTTIVAFLPLLFLQGRIGTLLGALPWVVLCALTVSLLESLVVMPAHMRHALDGMDTGGRGVAALGDRFGRWRDRRVIAPAVEGYSRLLRWCLARRYFTAALTVALLVASLGMVAGDRVPFTFLSTDDAETVVVDLRMPIGTSIEETLVEASRIERVALAQPESDSVSVIVGERANTETGQSDPASTNVGQVIIELSPVEERDRSSGQVVDAIRAEVGPLDRAELVAYREVSGGPGGADITVEVTGDDERARNEVVDAVKAELSLLPGVFDIADDDFGAQREVQIDLKPGAAALGFNVAGVARQVRAALFGLEAHTYAADREDIDVRVRFDEGSRRELASIEAMWLAAPGGGMVPLSEVASISEGSGYSAIRRIDRRRSVTVTADTDDATNPEAISAALQPTLDRLQSRYSQIAIDTGGRQRNVQEAFASLPIAAGAAVLMIYVILAWLFGSYFQPLAVMLAIPFGMIGVVWGHWLLGFDMTFLSLIGFVALAGVVVNNSLVLVDFTNGFLKKGLGLGDALVAAGRLRLRPIVLTSLTTVLGLSPLMLEQSFQARFLIPMAISISFGLISATALTLVVLPAVLVIIEDAKFLSKWAWTGRRPNHLLDTPPEDARSAGIVPS
ncbi:MAG: efflux RND transporter permease subunit [Phycisphaerales bacterium]